MLRTGRKGFEHALNWFRWWWLRPFSCVEPSAHQLIYKVHRLGSACVVWGNFTSLLCVVVGGLLASLCLCAALSAGRTYGRCNCKSFGRHLLSRWLFWLLRAVCRPRLPGFLGMTGRAARAGTRLCRRAYLRTYSFPSRVFWKLTKLGSRLLSCKPWTSLSASRLPVWKLRTFWNAARTWPAAFRPVGAHRSLGFSMFRPTGASHRLGFSIFRPTGAPHRLGFSMFRPTGAPHRLGPRVLSWRLSSTKEVSFWQLRKWWSCRSKDFSRSGH